MSNRKFAFGYAVFRRADSIAVLMCVLCTMTHFASCVSAQLISIEHTFTPSSTTEGASRLIPDELTSSGHFGEDLTEDVAAIAALDSSVQPATFTTLDPERLFADNVVYLDSTQEPATEQLNEFLPPHLSIPPMAEEHIDQPITLPSPVPPTDKKSYGCADESIHNFNVPEIDDKRVMFSRLMREPYSVYRSEQSKFAWLPAHGEDFGWFDWQSDPYLRRGNKHGLTGTINIHWLAGPISSPLPPRLYDFMLGYQVRNKLSDQFSYDLYTSVGAYSDFEASARDAIRFPSHAVGMFHINRSTDFVFGIDYLDRNDIPLLPVLGLSLRDVFVHGLRMDLVFPRPRIDYMLSETSRIYLAGHMDGGTWQVRFPDGSNPVMTYHDLRLMFGVESTEKDGSLSAWEFGYVFDRNLEFNNQPGHSRFNDAFVIQWISRH